MHIVLNLYGVQILLLFCILAYDKFVAQSINQERIIQKKVDLIIWFIPIFPFYLLAKKFYNSYK